MISSFLVTLGLVTVGAYAKPTVRDVGGLEVYLSTPTDKVASASDIRIFATVKNAGNEDLKILKLGTALDNEHHTRSFVVTKDGKEVPFTGITVPAFADDPSENDWIVISAGDNVTADHDVSTLYDFSANGPGTFTFDPVSMFRITGFDNSIKTASNTTHTVIANTRSVSITIPDTSKRELEFEKRRIFCPDVDQNPIITGSIFEARWLASLAVAYINVHHADDLYETYFGNYPISKVISNLNRIVDEWEKVSMFCTDPHRFCPEISSPTYTNLANKLSIFYCDAFYNQHPITWLCGGKTVVDAHNIRGGTVLRMLASLLIPGVTDNGQECSAGPGYTVSHRVSSASNYECFAAKVYVSRC